MHRRLGDGGWGLGPDAGLSVSISKMVKPCINIPERLLLACHHQVYRSEAKLLRLQDLYKEKIIPPGLRFRLTLKLVSAAGRST